MDVDLDEIWKKRRVSIREMVEYEVMGGGPSFIVHNCKNCGRAFSFQPENHFLVDRLTDFLINELRSRNLKDALIVAAARQIIETEIGRGTNEPKSKD